MKTKKTKISIATLFITALVCFAVAITGLIGMPAEGVSAGEGTTTVSTSTIIVNATDKSNAEVMAINKESVSDGATKVYVEYTLGDDDGQGQSFLFGKSSSTYALALKAGTSVWAEGHRMSQDNSHVWTANNPALYAASYKITYDLTAKTMTWYRGTTLILEKTDVDYSDKVTFGFFTYTNNTSGYFTAKIYDDMGKDLGVTSFSFASMSIVEGAVDVHKITLNTDDSNVSTTYVTDGTVFAAPVDPVKEGEAFFGWFTEETFENKYDFSKEVTNDVTLYAKFAEISTSTIIVNATGKTNAEVMAINKESVSDGATKVYVEYTLGDDDGQGQSFLFGKSSSTYALALKAGTSVWAEGHRMSQANSHVWTANNPALYAASYKITYDLTAKTMTWYRGTDLILEKTDVDYSDKVTFGFFTYTNDTSGYFTAKIYDDMGKDLGVTSFSFASMSIVEGAVDVHKITLNTDDSNVSTTYVADGTVFAKPATVKENHLLVGWYTDEGYTTEYDFNSAVSSNLTLYAKYIDYTGILSTGAPSIRVEKTYNSGIRFATKVDKDILSTITESGYTYTLGTLIVPFDYVADQAPTMEWLDENGRGYYNLVSTYDGNGDFYYGTLRSIKIENYGRKWVGLGYIAIEDAEGNVDYIYAEYDAANAKSIYDVAESFYNAYKDDADEVENVEVAKYYIDSVVVLDANYAVVDKATGTELPYEVAINENVVTITVKDGADFNINSVVIGGKIVKVVIAEDGKSATYQIA